MRERRCSWKEAGRKEDGYGEQENDNLLTHAVRVYATWKWYASASANMVATLPCVF
jgi:hypothetical protein